VTGYEGSWVIYVGSGLFSNFWKRDQPFTLQSKCLEIFHWRDGVQTNAAGELWMDETKVDACVQDTLHNPDKLQNILHQMMRIRDAKGFMQRVGAWMRRGSTQSRLSHRLVN
jgi:hypothetical protein